MNFDRAFHVVLFLGNGLAYLDEHLNRAVVRHQGLLEREWSSRRKRGSCATSVPSISMPISDAVSLLRGKRFAVYTGAGISVASGIPTFFGSQSLDERFALHEPFPGEVVAWMCADPSTLAHEIGAFQARILTATPNRAHVLLAQLESIGVVHQLITTNLDMLHESAGSSMVLTPQQFLKKKVSTTTEKLDALLVIGVSEDSSGLVACARASELTVVVADIQPPSFLADHDCYVQTDAESILHALVQDFEKDNQDRKLFAESLLPHYPTVTLVHEIKRMPDSVRTAIPDFSRLLHEISIRTTSGESQIHGWRHWMETAWLGLQVLNGVPNADPAIIFLFSLLHDCCRVNDAYDPDHGRRAAAIIGELAIDHLKLSEDQYITLTRACEIHADGYVTTDPAIGACWDADRLGLWRIGIRPDPKGLSLPYSRESSLIAAARSIRKQRLSFSELFDTYAKL